MKKFTMGLVVGLLITMSISVYASGGLEKITAYINNDVKVEIDGEKFTSEFPILVYEGRTYLPLRTVGEDILDKVVDWDNDTQTVLITPKINDKDVIGVTDVELRVEETTYKGLDAITADDETYFSTKSYEDKFAPVRWGYDSETNEVFLADTEENTSEILEVFERLDNGDPNAVIIHEGSTYVNTKHYKEPSELRSN